MSLNYNSAAIDGRNASTNGQASWVGEGWDLGFGYIERLYADCQVDKPSVWSSATGGSPALASGGQLEVRNTGEVAYVDSEGTTIWSSTDALATGNLSYLHPIPATPTSSTPGGYLASLPAGSSLAAGESLQSPNGAFTLRMQVDGNLVLYAGESTAYPAAYWATFTNGTEARRLAAQLDGSLVVFKATTSVSNADIIGDSCWRSPFTDADIEDAGGPSATDEFGRAAYVLSLGGASHELFPVGDNKFVAGDDPSLRVTRVQAQDPAASDGVGEYFIVQLSDGSTAYFGYGANGGGPFATPTESLLTRPVVGDDVGEPCHGDDFCTLGYRWMLDLQVDVLDNAMVVEYAPETNWTMARGTTATEYTRAALPKQVTYGYEWDGTSVLANPEARVDFETVDRCTDVAVHDPSRLGAGLTAPESRRPTRSTTRTSPSTCSATTRAVAPPRPIAAPRSSRPSGLRRSIPL